MRTDQNALTALNAQIGLPYRNFQRDVALLPLCGGHGICAVDRESTDRQQVAAAGHNFKRNAANKVGHFALSLWERVG